MHALSRSFFLTSLDERNVFVRSTVHFILGTEVRSFNDDDELDSVSDSHGIGILASDRSRSHTKYSVQIFLSQFKNFQIQFK